MRTPGMFSDFAGVKREGSSHFVFTLDLLDQHGWSKFQNRKNLIFDVGFRLISVAPTSVLAQYLNFRMSFFLLAVVLDRGTSARVQRQINWVNGHFGMDKVKRMLELVGWLLPAPSNPNLKRCNNRPWEGFISQKRNKALSGGFR